mmetsp:Transcript_7079/g.22343  ORF Transcript_7079/g.22343 Transcript_7079/m.22343 type:complete len:202 (-) Transcript_7079:39-644(-)
MGGLTTQKIRAKPAWRRVTVSHPFVKALRDGSMRDAVFVRWFEQDSSFGPTIKRLLAKTATLNPDSRATLERLSAADGSVYVDHAPADHTSGAPAIEATKEYREFVKGLLDAEHGGIKSVLLVVTWLVFEIYVEVWTTSLVPAAKPFCASLRPLAPDVDALREQVDAALLRADKGVERCVTRAVEMCMEFEVRFLDLLMEA